MSKIGQDFSTAAVFGASGGIGAALCDELVSEGVEHIYAGSRNGESDGRAAITPFRFDYDEPSTLGAAAELMADDPPQLVLVTTGVLTLADDAGPERSFKQLDADIITRVLRINTIGPALVARYMLPLFGRQQKAVFAALSARVGSIGDNRIGGWHSYRASKAALNMLVKNFAIELSRTHKQAVAVSLHPGTVDTALSEPFQSNLPSGQLTGAQDAARNLLDVIGRLRPEDSGHQFDWKGDRVPD